MMSIKAILNIEQTYILTMKNKGRYYPVKMRK